MSFVINQAIRHLQGHDYRVMSLAEPPSLADLEWMRETLSRSGYRVFAPLVPPPPGSLWRGTRHRRMLERGRVMGFEAGPRNPLDIREIVASDGKTVTYRYKGGLRAPEYNNTVTLRGWHGWRTAVQADRIDAIA